MSGEAKINVKKLDEAKALMTELAKHGHSSLVEVADYFERNFQTLNAAGVFVDLTDAKKNWPFNYQKLAKHEVKDIDKLSAALEKNDVKAIKSDIHNLSEHAFSGVIGTAYVWPDIPHFPSLKGKER